MNTMAIEIENKTDKLLAVLDKDIQHIQNSLSRLNELRSLVIKRDDAALSTLLETIRTESENYTGNETMRQSIRKELARDFGCDIKQITLSNLENTLPENKKFQIAKVKSKLKDLTSKLQKEYIATAMLLSDCVRLNRKFMNAVFNTGNTGTVIYDSNGITKRQIDTNLFNLRS